MSEADPTESLITGLMETTSLESTATKTQVTGLFNNNEDQYLNPSDKEIRLVVIGRTGDGKSTTCNSILDEKHFESSAGFRSSTKKTQYMKKDIYGYNLCVVDTPGIFDTDDEQLETLLEIVKCLLISSPGPHAFLLVISIQRYTKEAREAVTILRKFFGANALLNTIIVFTRKDELDGVTVKEALKQAPKDLLCLIEECGGRYVGFNNKAKRVENKRQVLCLLQKLNDIKHTGENNFFSSKIYDKVEAALKKEIQKQVSKIRKAHKQELTDLQEIIDKQRKKIELLTSNPLTTKDKAKLKQLMTKLENNKKLFDEKRIAMDNIIIGLRETMRMSITELGKDIFIGAALGGGAGAAFGALTGFGLGAVVGGPVGAVVGGFANGLYVYFKRRKETNKANELIEQMNTEVTEVLHGAYLKLNEPETDTLQ